MAWTPSWSAPTDPTPPADGKNPAAITLVVSAAEGGKSTAPRN